MRPDFFMTDRECSSRIQFRCTASTFALFAVGCVLLCNWVLNAPSLMLIVLIVPKCLYQLARKCLKNNISEWAT